MQFWLPSVISYPTYSKSSQRWIAVCKESSYVLLTLLSFTLSCTQQYMAQQYYCEGALAVPASVRCGGNISQSCRSMQSNSGVNISFTLVFDTKQSVPGTSILGGRVIFLLIHKAGVYDQRIGNMCIMNPTLTSFSNHLLSTDRRPNRSPFALVDTLIQISS